MPDIHGTREELVSMIAGHALTIMRLREAMRVAKTLIGAINDTAPPAVKAANINQAWHILNDNLKEAKP